MLNTWTTVRPIKHKSNQHDFIKGSFTKLRLIRAVAGVGESTVANQSRDLVSIRRNQRREFGKKKKAILKTATTKSKQNSEHRSWKKNRYYVHLNIELQNVRRAEKKVTWAVLLCLLYQTKRGHIPVRCSGSQDFKYYNVSNVRVLSRRYSRFESKQQFKYFS
jgi:hypothetical protein